MTRFDWTFLWFYWSHKLFLPLIKQLRPGMLLPSTFSKQSHPKLLTTISPHSAININPETFRLNAIETDSSTQWFNLQVKYRLSSSMRLFPFQIQLHSQRLCWSSLSSYCWLVICCFYWQFVRKNIKYFISLPELDSLFRVSWNRFCSFFYVVGGKLYGCFNDFIFYDYMYVTLRTGSRLCLCLRSHYFYLLFIFGSRLQKETLPQKLRC